MILIRAVSWPRLTFTLVVVLYAARTAGADDLFYSGHLKYQLTHTHYGAGSIFTSLSEQDTTDHSLDLRLIGKRRWENWDVELHYQMFGIYGDSLRVARELPMTPLITSAVPLDDTRRLFDLTSTIEEGEQYLLVHRLDRASIGFSGEQLVVRAGRHIVSWGNGLLFNPMDIFNPFDPTAIDKDYKTGDDMLYTQWLHSNGDDWQVVLIPRRDPEDGKVHTDQSSMAIKYHATRGPRDIDLLFAEHFAETVTGVGMAFDWAGSVVRADVVGNWGDDGFTPSAVGSVSYAWTWFGRNINGFAEYYYNGFGQSDGNYDAAALAENTALLARIARREVYNLGRNYFSVGATVELTPLWLMNPVLFLNLDDGSGLLQIVNNYDVKQNVRLLAGANLPFGPKGTEFGGIATATDTGDSFIGPGPSVFLKVAYFF